MMLQGKNEKGVRLVALSPSPRRSELQPFQLRQPAGASIHPKPMTHFPLFLIPLFSEHFGVWENFPNFSLKFYFSSAKISHVFFSFSHRL